MSRPLKEGRNGKGTKIGDGTCHGTCYRNREGERGQMNLVCMPGQGQVES